MSFAPDSLIDLRRYLAEAFGVERKQFGIAGTVTPRRPWGYHLGKGDIYGPKGMGNKDYSVQRRRDKAGLSNASAGFDINVGSAQERALVAFLIEAAKSGADERMLVEVIGPDPRGIARRWAKPNWDRPLAARQDHDWHIHLSFHRDTEAEDKRPIFAPFFGTKGARMASTEDEAEPDHPEEEEGLELDHEGAEGEQ
jgi:hypothetical protein